MNHDYGLTEDLKKRIENYLREYFFNYISIIIENNLESIKNVNLQEFKRMEVKKCINRIYFRIVELKNYTNKFVITESLKTEVEDFYRDL